MSDTKKDMVKEVLGKIKSNDVPNEIAPDVVTPAPAQAKEYNQYTSSLKSMKMITVFGKPIVFVNYRFLTDDPECIQYLDYEISKGLKYVVKGNNVTAEDADPMAVLKRRAIEEYLAEEAAQRERAEERSVALGNAGGAGIMSSAQLPNAAGSTSSI